jgi:metallo-beta-lactamase family protein
MAEAGRIKHHIKNNIEDPKNTIMMVGYCTPDSLGGRLKNGAKEVKIFGEWYPVKAKVVCFESYSAHGDYNDIFHFLACQNSRKIKKVFLVHGEPDTLISFKSKFLDKGYKDVSIPHRGEPFKLE